MPLTPHLTFAKIPGAKVPGAKMPGAKVMSALPIQLVFRILLATMTFGELFELRAMSSMMLRMVDAHLASLDPIYVLEVVDRLVAECKIEQAVRLLLHFVARGPSVRTPTVLMIRFILLCHGDVFTNEKYVELRAYLTQTFCVKALGEYPKFGLDPLTEEESVPHIPENTFQHAKLPEGIDDLGSGGASKDPVGPHHGRPNHFPENKYFEALCLYGYFLYKNGLFASSAMIVRFVLETDPTNYVALWLSGVLCHYHLKDFDACVCQYIKCIEANPNFAYAYYSLGVLLSDAGYTVHASNLYQKCLELDQNHHYARMNHAIALDEDDPEVLEQYMRIMDIHPTELYIYRAVARILLLREQPQPNPEDYPEDEQPDPLPPGPSSSDVAEAQEVLQRAIDIDPRGGGGEPLLDLGFLHLRHRNDIRKAIKCFKKFIEVAEDRELAERVQVLVRQLGYELRVGSGVAVVDEGGEGGDTDFFDSDFDEEEEAFFAAGEHDYDHLFEVSDDEETAGGSDGDHE